MQPLKLELRGFSGIQSGRGKGNISLDFTGLKEQNEMVALVGPNGAGKTTIMDNLHPYRVMPSRATNPTPGSFSYHDHIENGTGGKTLIWSHCGVTYKTDISLKMSGKTKKQEAFLFVVDGEKLTPYVNQSGQPSDGKLDIYDQCVEEILGPPELFFSTQFSSQGKKALSSMKVSEIKDILIGILGGEKIKKIAEKANEVVKLLKTQLNGLQLQANPHHAVSTKGQELKDKQVQIDSDIAQKEAQLIEVNSNIEAAVKRLGVAQANLSQNESMNNQRTSLINRMENLKAQGAKDIQQLKDAQLKNSQQALLRLSEIDQSLARENSTKESIETSLSEAKKMAADFDHYKNLVDSQANLEGKSKLLSSKLEQLKEQVKPLTELRAQAVELSKLLATTTADGKAISEAINSIKQTSELVTQVPCAGMDIQGKCKLLSNAIHAQSQIPVKENEKKILVNRYRVTLVQSESISERINQLIAYEQEFLSVNAEYSDIQVALTKANSASQYLQQIEAAMLMIPQYENKLTEISSSLKELSLSKSELSKQIQDFEIQSNNELNSLKNKLNSNYAEMKSDLDKLPPLCDENSIEDASNLVDDLKRVHKSLVEQLNDLKNQKFGIHTELEKVKAANQFLASLGLKLEAINFEISNWTLLAKAFGNDGIIALSIDDAGPEIAKYANRLLTECYGARFQVRLDTQKQSATGLTKETFQIMVEDTLRNRSTEVSLMSGGEKVWVNECVVRAFSLYMTQSTGVNCETLFSDESDGPLDPERKRQYMTMKREVLKIGGYKREYLITQTPELWEMADHIIDVTKS